MEHWIGSIDSMERGTVEWNSGMVERAINDPVPFLLANWACALATSWIRYWGTIDISTSVLKLCENKPVHVLLCCA